jgi:hypothetical protein
MEMELSKLFNRVQANAYRRYQDAFLGPNMLNA